MKFSLPERFGTGLAERLLARLPAKLRKQAPEGQAVGGALAAAVAKVPSASKADGGAASLVVRWQDWSGLALRHWRRLKRVHATRTDSERRLLVLGAVAIAWFVADTLLIGPSYAGFKEASTRYNKARAELSSKRAENQRVSNDIQAMTAQLKDEVDAVRKRVAAQKKDIESFQSGLVPAREMRQVLQGLLARTDGVRLVSMKTLSPEETAKLTPGVQDVPGMYRHGLDVKVTGGFNNLYEWLASIERLPRRLLWSGMRLELDEEQRLFLSVRVITLSPDAVPLEIAEP